MSSTEEYRSRINQISENVKEEPEMRKMRDDISEGIGTTGNRQADVEEQFQQVIEETTDKDIVSAPEIIAARNGKPNLKQRLDDENENVTRQLAQKAEQDDLNQTNTKVSGVNQRVDNLVIPISPENANLEVTDAHVSVTKGKAFDSLTKRFEEAETDISQTNAVIGVSNGADHAWEIGSISNVAGGNISLTNRIRTVDYIEKDNFFLFEMSDFDSFDYYIVEYDENKDFIKGGNYGAKTVEIGIGTAYVRAVIKKKDDAPFSEGDINSVPFNLKIYPKNEMATSFQGIETVIANYATDGKLTGDFFGWLWEYGSINNKTGENLNTDSNRMRIKELIKIKKGVEIKIEPSAGLEFYIVEYDVNGTFKRGGGFGSFPVTVSDDGFIRIVVKKVDSSDFASGDFKEVPSKIELFFNEAADNSKMLKAYVGGIGQSDGGITKKDNEEYVLTAIKTLNAQSSETPEIAQLPLGYLYHSSPTAEPKKLYYSTNQADNPKQIGELNFNPHHYQSAVGEDGDIIWVHDGKRTTKPRVHLSGEYNVSEQIQTDITPIAWLQNNGIDFAKDANGNEYCIFGEYTGSRVGKLYLWKVTKPYSDHTNWKRVLTQTQATDWQAIDGDLWHFHTVNHDPYTGVWYATSGDREPLCKWWYSTDEGETWTLFVQGDTVGWEAQISRVIGLIFTKDYIYWGNDYGTNHSLNRVSRDANGIIDPETRIRLGELNKDQSTYCTALLHSPPGVLFYDRVDWEFSSKTDKLDLEFWSFEDEKMHTLATFRRDPNSPHLYFGLRCKTYSVYQGIYDTRMIVGFGSSPNWIDLPYNDAERRTSLTFDIY